MKVEATIINAATGIKMKTRHKTKQIQKKSNLLKSNLAIPFSILFSAFPMLTSSNAVSAEADAPSAIQPIMIIDPAIEQREIHEAAIDTESFEVGLFTGTLAVEEFSPHVIHGLTASYHLMNRTLLQFNFLQTDVGRVTAEKLAARSLLKDSDREFVHYNIMMGYNLFPGKSFYGRKHKFHSSIYLFAGAGMTDFAGNSSFTPVIASSYRVVLTDWLTWSLDFKDYIFERDFQNDKKQTHNLEFSSSFNFLF